MRFLQCASVWAGGGGGSARPCLLLAAPPAGAEPSWELLVGEGQDGAKLLCMLHLQHVRAFCACTPQVPQGMGWAQSCCADGEEQARALPALDQVLHGAGSHGSHHHLRRVMMFGSSLIPWLLESGEDGGKQS